MTSPLTVSPQAAALFLTLGGPLVVFLGLLVHGGPNPIPPRLHTCDYVAQHSKGARRVRGPGLASLRLFKQGLGQCRPVLWKGCYQGSVSSEAQTLFDV